MQNYNRKKKVPVRKFSRGDVIRNKMSKSLLHSRKSQMLAENEQVPSGDLRQRQIPLFLPGLRGLHSAACGVL
jgi:hypothetical protein